MKLSLTRCSGLFLVVVLAGGLASCTEAEASLVDEDCAWGVRVIDGQMDYGFQYDLTVDNVAKAGNLTFLLKLSTSEGEWTRKQTVLFDAGERKSLGYFFNEPTINAENVQCRFTVLPF